MIRLTALVVAILCAASALPAWAGDEATQTDDEATQAEEEFRRFNLLTGKTGPEIDAAGYIRVLDINGDGKVDRAEWRGRRMYNFGRADANQDGYLDRKDIPWVSDRVFNEVDLDGDGRISAYEYNQAKVASFESIDLNGDGVLTLDEVEAYFNMLRL